MSKFKAFLTLLFSAIGVFGAREFYKPKNIKELLNWRGVKLANDDRAWDSMFFENEEDLQAMGIVNGKALWTWCSEKFKVTNLNDEVFNEAKKYCSDSATSIMGRIIRDGEKNKLIKEKDSEAFIISYLLTGEDLAILKLIGVEATGPKDLKKVAEHLEKWCKSQWKIKITSEKDKEVYGNFKTRCYDRKVKTVLQLLEKQGRQVISENKYKERFLKNLEYSKELIKDIRPFLEANKAKLESLANTSPSMRAAFLKSEREQTEEDFLKGEYGWRLYKIWCEDNLKETLLTEKTERIYPHIYKKIYSRCTEEKPK